MGRLVRRQLKGWVLSTDAQVHWAFLAAGHASRAGVGPAWRLEPAPLNPQAADADPARRRCCLLQVLLRVGLDEDEDEERFSLELNAALQPLTRLTRLFAHGTDLSGGLPALTALSRLQRLCLTDCWDLESLPGGPWCSSLRSLGASFECLEGSTGALAAAGQLEQVAAVHDMEFGAAPLTGFLRWAAAHPPLRRLALFLSGPSRAKAAMQRAALSLQSERPQLEVVYEPTPAGWRPDPDYNWFEVSHLIIDPSCPFSSGGKCCHYPSDAELYESDASDSGSQD